MGSPVSLASCSRMCLVGLGVCEKAVFSISSCLALIVVRGPRRFDPAPPSPLPPPAPPSGLLFSVWLSRVSGSPSSEPVGHTRFSAFLAIYLCILDNDSGGRFIIIHRAIVDRAALIRRSTLISVCMYTPERGKSYLTRKLTFRIEVRPNRIKPLGKGYSSRLQIEFSPLERAPHLSFSPYIYTYIYYSRIPFSAKAV